MNDIAFLLKVYRYAEYLKGTKLTDAERATIVDDFNQQEGSAEQRAVHAIREVIGVTDLKEELRKSANLDNSRRLLKDLHAAAREWQLKKNSK